MRYFDFLRDIQEISNSHILVNEYGEGDIYEFLNNGEHKYPCVFLTVTNLTTSISGTQINFTLFYTDRLVEDSSNKKSIQSTGINVIKQLLSKFEQEHPTFDIDSVNYQPFTEKFADMCAGVFCNVVLENPTESVESYDNDCEEGAFEFKTITLTANGIYDVIGYDKAVVAVPEIPLTNITITENGVYKADEGGYGEVVVDVPETEIELISGTFTQNAIYNIGNFAGWNEVIVDVKLDIDDFESYKKVKVGGIKINNDCIVDGTWIGYVIFDKTTLTSFNNMFSECSDLITLNADGWMTENVSDMGDMFNGCKFLTTIGDLSNWDVSNVIRMDNMFYDCETLQQLDLSNWNTGNVLNTMTMFYDCKSLTTVGDLSNWEMSNNISMDSMFHGCKALTTVGDLSNWDVSNVKIMNSMFYDCKALTTVGDLSNWNVGNVTNTKYMFRNCDKIQQLNVSNWKSDSLIEASRMFQSCDTLTEVNIANWEMSNLVDVNNMFEYCGKLQKIDASNWIAPNLKDISFIFTGCQALTDLNITGWDTSSVTNLWCAFQLCSSLTSLDLTSWDVSNVTNMNAMFRNCSSLTDLNVSGWNTSNLTDMAYMFFGCKNLQTVDLTSWDASNLTDIENLSSQAGIVNYVGGRTIDEVIENNITILNGLNVSAKHNIFSSYADRASVRALINGLPDLTGENFKILYLDGAYSKATAEDKAIATAKNWRIA